MKKIIGILLATAIMVAGVVVTVHTHTQVGLIGFAFLSVFVIELTFSKERGEE